MNVQAETEECKKVIELLPCLKEKFIVDFANGIDVARDHNRVQREHAGFFVRLFNDFSGRSAQRQAEVNASLIDGVEGALNWLTELTETLTISNLALVKVSERVNELQHHVVTLAEYSRDTRERLKHLSIRLGERCDALEQEIARVDFEQRAERQLEQMFNRWRAGRYASLSVAGRLYAVLEELHWGDFGAYCRTNNGQVRQSFLDDLINRAISQLADDLGFKGTRRHDVAIWMSFPVSAFPDAMSALAYLGDWTNPNIQPFTYTVTQAPVEQPLKLPRLCAPDRVARALVAEVFEEERK
jgi:hypothetical protein